MSSARLKHIPREPELERMYYELARLGARSLGAKRPWAYHPQSTEALIALAAEMSRYDARLLEVLLQWLRDHWSSLNPLRLRQSMSQMHYPQTIGVLCVFLLELSDEPELNFFCDYLCAGLSRVDPAESYFVDGARPGSREAERVKGLNLSAYARWGFIGVARPIADIATRKTVGRYDAAARRNILITLSTRREEFTLREYLDALEHCVSRQQALADIRALGQLRRVGRGRGARWAYNAGF